MNRECVRHSSSPQETERLGELLAEPLQAGDVIALEGPLGTGKTCFVRGLARGLSCRARVRSPSFTLVNEYRGEIVLLHLDLYRIEPAEAEGLGLEEYAERGALVVEWGEKLPSAWRERALVIELERTAETERRMTATAREPRALEVLEAWRRVSATGAPRGAG